MLQEKYTWYTTISWFVKLERKNTSTILGALCFGSATCAHSQQLPVRSKA